jgi:hypothetical protein
MRHWRSAARMGWVEGTLGAADFRAIRVARREAALTAAHGQQGRGQASAWRCLGALILPRGRYLYRR